MDGFGDSVGSIGGVAPAATTDAGDQHKILCHLACLGRSYVPWYLESNPTLG